MVRAKQIKASGETGSLLAPSGDFSHLLAYLQPCHWLELLHGISLHHSVPFCSSKLLEDATRQFNQLCADYHELLDAYEEYRTHQVCRQNMHSCVDSEYCLFIPDNSCCFGDSEMHSQSETASTPGVTMAVILL